MIDDHQIEVGEAERNVTLISLLFQVAREVDIHKRMKHKNVVQFIKFFEDTEHVFIILEYCGSKVGLAL